jgi:hypothetical protein
MSDYARTCRLCGVAGFHLIKYGTRCYAHPACFIERKSIRALMQLPEYSRRELEAWMDSEEGRKHRYVRLGIGAEK